MEVVGAITNERVRNEPPNTNQLSINKYLLSNIFLCQNGFFADSNLGYWVIASVSLIAK